MTSPRILLIDDHAMFRSGLRMVLNASLQEAEVSEAGTLHEAIQGEPDMPDATPDVILLDIKLPGMDGIEFVRRIKADPKLIPIPVVVLTTSGSEKEIAECYRCGANSYIVKPVDFERFSKVIKELKLYWMVVNSLPK